MQERQRFEENWKEAFEGAELTPPDRIWTNLELDLAEGENERMKKRVVFYQRMAAALVLVSASLGLYVWTTLSDDSQQTMATNAVFEKENSPEASAQESLVASNDSQHTTEATHDAALTPASSSQSGSVSGKQNAGATPGTGLPNSTYRTKTKDVGTKANSPLMAMANESQQPEQVLMAEDESAMAPPLNTEATIVNEEKPESLVAQTEPMTEEEALKVLQPFLEVKEGNKEKRTSARETLWLAMGAAAGSYNPGAGLAANGADRALNVPAFSTADMRSGQTSRNQVGSAYSIGVAMGKKLSDRWVVQSGLSYVNQQIDYSSNLLAFTSANKAQLYTPEYATTSGITNDGNFSALTTTDPYTINSAIELISIPVQAGYLIVDKKVGWQVNGGFSSDLFLRNTLVDESGQVEKFSQGAGEESPYRTVSWSGLLNTELSYRLGDQYRFSLVPGMRYALNSVLKEGTSTPLILDMGFRFRYIVK
ncbi:MAG: outer membrane beta-barrel protein [Bacteroidota bacterium]